MPDNPQETEARYDKAQWLAKVLTEHGATAESVLSLPDAHWRIAAELVTTLRGRRCGMPSESTRLLVATLMRQAALRSTTGEKLRRMAEDPFAGLPGCGS